MADDYESRDGIITSPGKFEGEPVWVPQMWDECLEGGSDEDKQVGEVLYSLMTPNPDEKDAWPELDTYGVVLWESPSGFVHHHLIRDSEEWEDYDDED